MDEDVIDFSKVCINTRTPFKTQNVILRWRTAITVLICIVVLIVVSLMLKSVNGNYNQLNSAYETIKEDEIKDKNEYIQVNKELKEKKEQNNQMRDAVLEYEQAITNLNTLYQMAKQKKTELKTKNEIKKGKKDELKEKYSELTITTKEYQALRTQNDELKKEYYELGGK